MSIDLLRHHSTWKSSTWHDDDDVISSTEIRSLFRSCTHTVVSAWRCLGSIGASWLNTPIPSVQGTKRQILKRASAVLKRRNLAYLMHESSSYQIQQHRWRESKKISLNTAHAAVLAPYRILRKQSCLHESSSRVVWYWKLWYTILVQTRVHTTGISKMSTPSVVQIDAQSGDMSCELLGSQSRSHFWRFKVMYGISSQAWVALATHCT